MSDLESALSRANKLMTRKDSGPKPPPRGGLARQSTRAFLIGFLLLCVLIGSYAVWIDHTRKPTATPVPPPASQPIPSPASIPEKSTLPAAPLPTDPELEARFQGLTLSAILVDPPRVQINGKIYSLDAEVVPGLWLREITKQRIVAEDASGARYHRTF